MVPTNRSREVWFNRLKALSYFCDRGIWFHEFIEVRFTYQFESSFHRSMFLNRGKIREAVSFFWKLNDVGESHCTFVRATEQLQSIIAITVGAEK